MEDVKFIRLAFCDVFGKERNIAILPTELDRAFKYGIAIDASAIAGFGGEVRSDLFLQPEPETITSLPWRSENGRVVRILCSISKPDGSPFACDCRSLLKKAVADANEKGISFTFGSELEFYLFKTDDEGRPTNDPFDNAGYMDVAPDDKGENVRREICLTLSQMGIRPESSHHEEGPGQNEIDFRYSDPLHAADNALTFKSVVKNVANRHGLVADFSPKPLKNQPGSGFHINIAAEDKYGKSVLDNVIAGIMSKICDITAFLNSAPTSYDRLGNDKAPLYVSWSRENRSQLIRLPAAPDGRTRAELRSSDACANPHLAFALLIYAGLYGIENNLPLPKSADINLFNAPKDVLKNYQMLPSNLDEAIKAASGSSFVKEYVPAEILNAYCK